MINFFIRIFTCNHLKISKRSLSLKKIFRFLYFYSGMNGLEFGPYTIETVISTVGRSIVYGGRSKHDGKLYACKFVDRTNLSNSETLLLEHELRIHSYMNHPSIIEFKEALYTKEYIIVVTEYCENGDLLENIRERKITGSSYRRIFYDILLGIEYIHAKGFCHFDLKPENIFIDKMNRIKIGDFGCCIEASKFDFKNVAGTLSYLAPELLENEYTGFDPRKCDMWSIGVVFYAIINKTLPFSADNDDELIEQIVKGKYLADSNYNSRLNEIIDSCLITDPNHRKSAYDLVNFGIFDIERESRSFLNQSRKSMRSNENLMITRMRRDMRITFMQPKKANPISYIGHSKSSAGNVYLRIPKIIYVNKDI
ncbi:CAMK family protein kinase [Tritrichomonas foetus]|uniref:CAMK family protein kinase n=1 Tax=Tritrichomonas foetus TaxID=1144522 RepID=A0A1J4JYG2_9EUKA|nr:CAMK family protein kinase [Tritrichomonas foetus]|eukprot:OHT02572.1 CAMK family protein kinase [Tritrichomonas foetus]